MIEKEQAEIHFLLRVFAPFRVDKERHTKVSEQIKEQASGTFSFYVMSFLAGIIITLGILIDSAAVVIGGMLIAPLVWPILAIALAIATGRSSLMHKSLFTLFKSILVILFIALVIGLIMPELVLVNNEFLSRVHPTIFELFIGLAAGFIGAFIVTYPKMGSAIAGVVVAAAMVPPIAIAGLSLAKGDFQSMGGALLLFLSNLIAVVFAAAILFLLANFKSTGLQTEENRKSGFRWSILILVIILVPLIFITKETTSGVTRTKVIREVIGSTFANTELFDLRVTSQNKIITIDLSLRAHEKISLDQIEAVKNVLSKRFESSVVLKVNIIPIISPGENFSDYISVPVQIETAQVDEAVLETNTAAIKCPVILNGESLIRDYPRSFGCPVCPQIVICSDGRELPIQEFNADSNVCLDKVFSAGGPCHIEESSPIEVEVINQ